MSDSGFQRQHVHNQRWQAHWDCYVRYHTQPLYAPGLHVWPAIRDELNRFLPVTAFAASLAWVAERTLPHPDWVPRCLRTPHFSSMHDLWRDLPVPFQGRVCFQPNEWAEILVALAAPARFGTSTGRYPAQLRWLTQWRGNRPCSLLDVGSGTGGGTSEFRKAGFQVLGITREPLEAMIAWRSRQIRTVVGEIGALPIQQPVDVVVCNGLIGGAFLHHESDLQQAWRELLRVLKPGGILTLADRFHAGRKAGRARFLALAPAAAQLVLDGPNWWLFRKIAHTPS